MPNMKSVILAVQKLLQRLKSDRQDKNIMPSIILRAKKVQASKVIQQDSSIPLRIITTEVNHLCQV